MAVEQMRMDIAFWEKGEKMPRLTDADALIAFMRKGWRVFPSSKLQHTCDITDIENAPTVDAEPVRHGHWTNISISVTGSSSAECSLCGTVVHDTFADTNRINYCPHCGAKMDEEGS